VKHHLNRQRQRNVLGLNNPADVTLREVKRGDNSTFEVIVCDDFGAAVELDATLTLTDFRFTAKVVGALGAESAIVSATSYTKTGTGSATVYTLAPAFTGTALGDLFPTGGTQRTPADATARLALTGLLVNAVVRQVDTGEYWMLTNAAAPSSAASWSLEEARKDYVDLAGEFEYVLDGKQFSYPTFTLRVWDDVSKGNETTSGALPVSNAFVGLALTAFTGGGSTALDGLDITGFPVGSIVQMVASSEGVLSAWQLTAPAAITANSLANPTVVTSAAHGLPAGTTNIVIGGSNSTPTIDGARTATYVGANTFSVPVNVTVAGTSGYWGPAENAAAGIVRPDTNYLGRYWVRVMPRSEVKKVSAADSVRASTSFVTDATFAVPVLAGETWELRYRLLFIEGNGAGAKAQLDFTGMTVSKALGFGILNGSSSSASGDLILDGTSPAPLFSTLDDSYHSVDYTVTLTATVGGTVNLQWGCSSASDVTLNANSSVVAQRIS
jgi:hypothetical protein